MLSSEAKRTILFIDDDVSLRDLVKAVLELEGFKVLTANSGAVGIGAARKYQPDLIICDIMMPEMDGWKVLDIVRNDPMLAATLFIFLTIKNTSEDFRKGMNAGADDYLPKPFKSSELLLAIQAAFLKQEIRKQVNLEDADLPKQHQIFLSYSRTDTEIMHRVRSSLIDNELSVWTDENLEIGTENWDRAVAEAMKKSEMLVVILSPNSERSRWVGRELTLAEMLGLRIFPILARGDAPDAIPIRLVSHQRVDIRHNYGEGMEKLILSIRKHLKLDD